MTHMHSRSNLLTFFLLQIQLSTAGRKGISIYVKKGVRAALYWSSELHELNVLLAWEGQHPKDYVHCKQGFTTEKL